MIIFLNHYILQGEVFAKPENRCEPQDQLPINPRQDKYALSCIPARRLGVRRHVERLSGIIM